MKDNTTLAAILGGTPSVTESHDDALNWPVLTGEDEQAVIDVMRDGDISTHPVIRELEKDYANFTNRRYALAHNNGTSGLLAAFFAIDLKPGDEVIVPSATFWASVVPMLWLGALPVFCESEPDRLGIDPEDIEKKITPRTKAIVVVHLWGLPSKMKRIKEIAERYNLKIIEDASHAHGAYWNNQPCGSLGDISVFSLQGDKLAPGGEGGIFLCDNPIYIERATCLGDITRIIELETPARRFAATSFGIKTRIAPISAAIARVQLKHLNKRNTLRTENLEYLSKGIEKYGFHAYLAPKHIKRTYFEFIVRYDTQKDGLSIDELINALQSEGCRIDRPRYPLLHQQPLFTEGAYKSIARLGDNTIAPDYSKVTLPITEQSNSNLIKLPSFPNPSKEIIDQYLRAFKKVFKQTRMIKNYFTDNKTKSAEI